MFWFTFFLFLASFLLTVLLAPKPELEDARKGRLGDLRFPRATAGSPVSYIFGKVRLRGPNTLWYGAFYARAVTKNVNTGWFSSETVVTGWIYHISMDLGFCTGPDVTLHGIWVEKKRIYTGSANGDGAPIVINQRSLFGGYEKGGGMQGTVRFYSGSFTQSQNDYLMNSFPLLGSKLPAYVGISHLVFEDSTTTIHTSAGSLSFTVPFYIGTSPSLRPMSFELSRYPDNLGLTTDLLIGDDLNPMEILYSALTEEWGGLGTDSADLDTTSMLSVGATLKTEENGMSLAIEKANTGKTIIEEILRQVDGILYQDPATGKIKVRLIREDYSIPSLPVFNEANLKTVHNFSRTSWAETTNQVRVVYNQRSRNYEEAAALAQDMANIEIQGRVKTQTVSLPGVTEDQLAADIASRVLSQRNIPLFSSQIEAHRDAQALVPGDPFVFQWDDFNITQTVMRVQRFDFGELINGKIVMDVIQDTFAVADTLYGAPGDTLWSPEDRSAVDITEFEIFGSPAYFVDQLEPSDFTFQSDYTYFWALPRRPQYMESFTHLTSDDTFNKDIVTEIEADFPMSCRLRVALLKEQGQKEGVVTKLEVKATDPPGNPFSDTTKALIASDGENLLRINGEWLAYETVTVVDADAYEYDLNNVHRALFDTNFEDHAVDDPCYIILGSDHLSRVGRPDASTFWHKLLSTSDQGSQEEGDVSHTQITNVQAYDAPAPPDRVTIEGVRTPIEIIGVTDVDLAWRERNRFEGTVAFVDDATDTPESATNYATEVFIDGISIDTGYVAASTTDNMTGLAGSGILRAEVQAHRTSPTPILYSLIKDFDECFYANYQNQTSELVINGDFEATFPGSDWTISSGTWADTVTVYPLDPVIGVGATTDNEHLECIATGSVYQDIDITSPDYRGQSALFRAWKGGLNTTSLSKVNITQIDSPSTTLESTDSDFVVPTEQGVWELIEIPVSIRSDCDIIRITITALPDAVWDNISFKANTVSIQNNVEYDTITNVTVEGAWGLRLMDSGYSGVLVRIRDTYDDSTIDVSANPDGDLDSYYVRGEARVVRLYDQSGNGAHLEARSESEQPLLIHFLSETGRPGIKFDDDTKNLVDTVASKTRPYMVTRPNMSLAMSHKESTPAAWMATIPHEDTAHTSPYYRWGLTFGTTDWRWSVDGTEENDAGNGNSYDGKNVVYIDYQNGEFYHNDDATSAKSFTPSDIDYSNNDTRLVLAENAVGNISYDGHTGLDAGNFYELCIFSGNVAAGDRQTIMEGIADYWFNLSI
jgi:hypothetical protein